MNTLRDHLTAIRKAWHAALDAHHRSLDAARKRRKHGPPKAIL
ncbi:hypothetical protein [Methylibium sp.]|nr:hypothetical protein [Methylibium sp.]